MIWDHITIILALPDRGSHRPNVYTNGRYDALAICTFSPPLPPRIGSRGVHTRPRVWRVGLTQQQQQESAPSSQHSSTLFRWAFGDVWGVKWGFVLSNSQPILRYINNETMQWRNDTRMGDLSPTNNEWCMWRVSNTIILVYVTLWRGIIRQSASFHFINSMHIRAQLLQQMRR